MNTIHATPTVEGDSQTTVLNWAVEKQVEANVSFSTGSKWHSLRTTFKRFDREQGIMQVTVVAANEGESPALTMPATGEQIGVSFRRGHKKCLFLSTLIMVQAERDADGTKTETLVLRLPKQVRSIQRRAFQRVVVPESVFIAAKIWEGGLPGTGPESWPICSGRVSNISMGGVLIETRFDQNPRLSSGEVVGVEISTRPGEALLLDGMFRHCVVDGQQRLGLGFHFPGIEHELPGRATIAELSEFVSRVRSMQG